MNTAGSKTSFKKEQMILGRWERRRYKILSLIGCGGNASVYLVEDQQGLLKALKISSDIYSITCEYRTMVFLRCCRELRNTHIMPRVYEIDEFQVGSTVYHFIVMEYCMGENLGLYKGRLREMHAIRVGSRVARFLSCLHKAGLVFGDLKPSNIIYDLHTGAVRVVDYGSVTVKGKKLNQFTPCYDRASWRAGSRTADEHYDMFALGLLLAVLLLGKLYPCNSSVKKYTKLTKRIKNPDLKEIILKALAQTSEDCGELADNFAQLLEKGEAAQNQNRLRQGTVINYFGAFSVVSFIMSLVYYYGAK